MEGEWLPTMMGCRALPPAHVTKSQRWAKGWSVIPGTRRASSQHSSGRQARVIPARWAARSAGRIPLMGRMLPSRASSPRMTHPVQGAAAILSLASSREAAMARSKPDPDFGSPAGESPTVTCRSRTSSPQACRALRIRSFASRSAASGSPTRVKETRPRPTWVSTSMIVPSSPLRTTDLTVAMRAFMRSLESTGRGGRMRTGRLPRRRRVGC